MDPFSRENNIYDGILVDADFIDKSTQSFTMSSTGMSPSIAMGDVVLYQPLKENQKFHDHKCVVEIDGDMTVKIIQKLMTTGKYSLISTGPGNVKDFFKEEDIGGVVKILGIVIGKVTKRLY
jgi:phage repressor protein C with HTH and peptisase S24 domain